MVSTTMFSNTTVFYIINNKKCFLTGVMMIVKYIQIKKIHFKY